MVRDREKQRVIGIADSTYVGWNKDKKYEEKEINTTKKKQENAFLYLYFKY